MIIKVRFHFTFLLVALTSLSIAQQITVDNSLPVEQLVLNALDEDCIEITNINSPVNGSVVDVGSFGFFERGASNFPFQNGLFLTSGDANAAGNGENNDILNEGETSWGTDPDLDATLGISNTLNATTIEFDFTSISSILQFNYILASEEYVNNFPCQFSDGFAFLIREASSNGPYTNIALIPATGTAVNTMTIRPEITGFCEAQNEQFFEGFNIGDTNYNGRTTAMTATASITPNVAYHIKLIIADQRDRNYDSAVFIEANSFTPTVDLGEDFSTCADSVTLDGDIGNPDAQFEWYLDGAIINGANDAQYDVTESGNYQVVINIPLGAGFCTIDDDINVLISNTQSTTPMTDFGLCDDPSNDGEEAFDLTTKDNQAINSVAPGNYNVSYHTSLPDAQNNNNPIIGDYTNAVNPQLIYVRIEDIDNGCLAINQFQIEVFQRPTIIDPPVLEVCDDAVIDGFTMINLNESDDAITNGQTGLVVTYHFTQADADANSNPIPMPYVNDTTPMDMVFVSVTNSGTNCNTTTTLDIMVLPPPDIANDQEYFIDACDDDYDGFANFDITEVEAEILNGLTDVTITYHLTQADALSGENPIPDPTNFFNTDEDVQIVYIRVIDNTTGCPSIAAIELHTNLLLTEPEFNDIVICDIDNDGMEAFDLNSIEASIIGELDDVVVMFYETEGDRDNALNELDQDVDYMPSTFPQTLYLILTSPTCTEVEDIVLDIDPIILFDDPEQQTVCDNDQDEIVTIDLSDYDAVLTENQPGFQVTYFATQQNADDNEDELPNIYQNTQNPFTLFARITSIDTSCSDTSSFEILVNPAPETMMPTTIIICDDDQDGRSIVDLNAVIPEVVNDTTNRNIEFYNNISDANTQSNPIIDLTNYNAQTETVVIRVDNTQTMCPSFENLSIIVNTLPVFTVISDFVFCENNTDNVGEFLLRTKDNEILNGQTGKEVSYFLNQNDADNNSNEINKNSNFENTSNPQTIFVRVQNISDADCYGTSTFQLDVGTNPNYNPQPDMFVCDEDVNDASTEIDLTAIAADINAGIPENSNVIFYATVEDFNAQTNAITTATYATLTNPQEIYYAVENNTNCASEDSFIVNVLPIPSVLTIAPFEDCDIDYDESVIWNLTDAEINIQDIRQDSIEVTYFLTEENAEAQTSAIADPENFENTSNPQTVYVRIVNTDFNCPVILPIELNVISPPAFNDFGSTEICDNDTDTYNLNEIDNIILDANNTAIVSYYNNQEDAINNNNAISGDYNYQTNNDIIYARIEDPVTTCFTVYPFMLVVNDRPIANRPNDLEECDDDADTRLEFDLELQNDAIIGTQDDTFLVVTYHNTEAEAMTNFGALQSPYNTQDGEVIYARVTNTETTCFSITQFNVIVNPLPIVDIGDWAICPERFPLQANADTGFPGDTYLWSTGEMTSEIEIRDSGMYSVTVTTPNGCTATSDFNVVISEPAIIEVVETVDFSDPNNITITVSGIGDYLFQLDGGPLQDNGLFENVNLGYHTLTIIDQNGCASVTREVLVIDAPKFMTPNNDGDFDTWHIIGVETLPGTIVQIFDRYGKLLKTLSHTSLGWDGVYNGNRMPASDYWWSADIKGGDIEFTATGHFALRR